MNSEIVRKALETYLGWMDGFEESGLYKNYRDACGFTDDEWVKTLRILDRFAADIHPNTERGARK